ncbi:GNAT family N-acetyltransferase [Saccharopolyspora sp. ASAGF58]|uniref:GNAT family N-acetyltransferase n=1 Tax=Saccharopolyspora sp. ASAGF58 TaxID=2719023 RepID=UPI00143FEE85|nr:GNAT family N-acetyltransferase [Saccharopolyspora sp. ASAGF58]QIZ33589.1 GNAT family N-acetyltransferase [Saccharopolyspora sp. ASAGF58]
MTSGQHRHAREDWTRELIELAALLLAAGTANVFVTGVQSQAGGTLALLFIGAVLLVASAARWWRHRRRPSAQTTAPAAVPIPEVVNVQQTLWRLRASVTDTPGRLARLAGGLSALGADIRTMQVHPVAGGVVDEVLLHVPTRVSRRELIAAVETAGGCEVTAERADVRELDDVPTRTANLAIDLVNGRTDLIRALRALLGQVAVHWREAPEPSLEVGSFTGGAMCLADPGGGVLVLERPGGSFTPAEFARARAVVDLAESCRARVRPVLDVARTASGAELTVRLADRADVELVSAFHERCSSAARYRSCFSPGPTPGERGLQRLLTPALGRSLLALAPDGDVVGMGNLMYDGDSGELALLVRDDWQRQGVGTALARKLVEQAEELGIGTLTAHTDVDNTAIARTLRGAGLRLVGAPEPGEWSWSRELRPEAGSAVT